MVNPTSETSTRRSGFGSLILLALLSCLGTNADAHAMLVEPYRPPLEIVQMSGEFAMVYKEEGSSYGEHLQGSRDLLTRKGYKVWSWTGQASKCKTCPIFILPHNEELENVKVYAFIRALESKKSELLALYGGDPQEYNLLAQIAVGILGRESEFFESPRYRVKENSQLTIRLVKVVQIYLEGSDRGTGLNSRGPTQIKIVPAKIAQKYGVTRDNLYIPENAALATMGYLMDILAELKRRVVLNHLSFITPNNYADYLPYIYFGSRRQLLNGTATPDQNIYIRDMRKYMTWIEIYEGPPQSQPLFRP